MKISRRDFLKKFAAMAAAGTMGLMPGSAAESDTPLVDAARCRERGPYEPEFEYGDHECHLCELEPWSCGRPMYRCYKLDARMSGASVEIKRWDHWNTRREFTVGIVHP